MSKKRARTEAAAGGAAAGHLAARDASFTALWEQGRFCDVTIQVDSGERFEAHRLVLAAGSDYFKALFSSAMRESAEDVVTISEIAADDMRAVLRFLYTLRLEAKPETLAGVMMAASRLEVPSLLALGAESLASTLTLESCIASWAVAVSIGRPELDAVRAACEKMAEHLFKTLSQQPDFHRLSLDMLKTLLCSDALMAGEDVVFEALDGWLSKCSPPLAAAQKLELFSLVRYPLMEPTFLADRVEGVLTAYEGGKELLYEAYRHQALRPTASAAASASSPRTRPRMSHGVHRSIPNAFLTGWKQHIDEPYSHVTTLMKIESVPAEATHIFVGARAPDGTIALGACGRRDEVLRRTSSENETHEENGAFW
mmetsp:Transcript_47755/g.156407  ORF Transcript_47755/g.156407 Transcript_47755/m.156407 type:complete len:370 (+) Transcript_47755:95-1204(+)